MVPVLTFVIPLLFCISCILGYELYNLNYKYKCLYREKEELLSKRISEVLEYNLLASKYNQLVRAYHTLKQQQSNTATPSVKNVFTTNEIKRLKYYLHPDKHGGKTNDLFVKITKSFQ